MDPVALLILILAIAAALAIGWWLGARPVAAARAEAAARGEEFKRAIVDLAAAEERARAVPGMADELGRARAEREAAAARAAALEAELASERSAHAHRLADLTAQHDHRLADLASQHDQRLADLRTQHERSVAHFREVAGQVLGEAQKSFLERADQRFAHAGETSEAKLKALLQPMEVQLRRYEENLGRVEKEREGSYGELRQHIAALAQANVGVVRETQRLANVMRSSPKARGRWGEEQLRTILEQAGLAENVDFSLQSTVSDGERQLRPDCIVNLPGDRCIVIDVKCPLVAFEQAYDEEDEVRRSDLLLQHANALKSYASDLGRKGYWRQFDRSPDFVIMFVPGEHFLAAAAERAPELIETAFRNGVIIASTINMLALAKVMAGMWRQEQLHEQAMQIAEVGRELYKRLATMSEHVERMGNGLAQANSYYNKMVGSLESQVYTQARRFETLGVETSGKAVKAPPVIEEGVRPLTKLAVRVEAEAAE